ncbi:hypothetical protein [Accumulibacter sp.]|uniref:hypothetical protein n=1 Tax=Accumulibacter sp. TaxID=2053492 RepID=UPI002C64E0C5|nr:hypothetical protein [Accumulibacter sp.]HMW78757.1 hypothetical protein [Accumulibacter sp.]HNG14669.1 hypothetical protein [Accumulibacter sp.]HNI49816.1 hypothetical protein [Accumulibacter sp.]HNN82725.1 hypothetical protein [Accumulibacter sp.]
MSHNVGMNDSSPVDPRRRLRELLTIPERDRTDEQWDEIIDLEITLAPGNRDTERYPDRSGERQPEKRAGVPASGTRRPELRNKPPRPNVPRQEVRPPAARPEGAHDVPPDGKLPDPRIPKRHGRRPRRLPETPGEG